MTVNERLKQLHRVFSTVFAFSVFVVITTIFIYSKLFDTFTLAPFFMLSIAVMVSLWLLFHLTDCLLHQRPVRLLIWQLRQRLHQKSVWIIIGFVVLLTVMIHITSCTHVPKSNPSILIEAKPKLIAQQTRVNNANNYVYAPKGLYQHTDQTTSGVMPESLATDTHVAVHQSIEGETK